MFGLKSTLGAILSPLALAGLLALVAVALVIRERTRRIGVGILCGLTVIAYALGTTPVADLTIAPLEYQYPTIRDPRFLGDVGWVVVLGASHALDRRAGPTARIETEGLHRLAEGVRLWRALPDARLHLSGWGGGAAVSYADAAADAVRALGVPDEALVLSHEPRDTYEEAQVLAMRLEPDDAFLLVTSAAHLPRAVRHFEEEGLRPIPAPAYFHSLERGSFGVRDLLPHPRNYVKVDRAVHEYLGILWGRVAIWR